MGGDADFCLKSATVTLDQKEFLDGRQREKIHPT